METLLSKIENYLLYAVIFLLFILALPISPNPFAVTSAAILTFGVGLLLLLRAFFVISSGTLELRLSKFDFPILLIGASYVASAIVRTPSIMEAFLLPGNATIVAGAVLLYFIINQQNKSVRETLSKVLVFAAGIHGFIVVLAFTGIFESIPQLPAYMQSSNFTPGGGYLPTVIFLGSLIPLTVENIIKEKNVRDKILVSVSGALMVFALGISIFNILPGRPLSPQFPSVNTSWSIAVDSLKESPILGIGPGNYLTAFNRYRPLDYNQTDIWGLKFSTARSYYLTGLTEAGLLFAAGLVLLALTVYRTVKTDLKENKLMGWGLKSNLRIFSLIVIAALLLFFPASHINMVLLFILLALYAKTDKTSLNLTAQAEASANTTGARTQAAVASRFPALLVTVPIIVAIALLFVRSGRILAAEYTFKRSLDAFAGNEAIRTYDTMQQAINRNPLVDRYRLSYSQVNLALANSLASQEEITDQDRNNIAQLIQQSIREGKAAVAINPTRAGNWVNLGNIYRSIIPFAQGADVFALQTYNNAASLDPFNPNIRISLGGIFYAAGNYEAAIDVFQRASQVKPDLANAHYNLAFAYRNNGQIDQAMQEITTVMSLVDRDSSDYELAQQALDQIQSEQQELSGQQGQELNPPAEGQEQVLEPPLDLPEDANPPEAPITPTPTPTDEEDQGDAEGETEGETTSTPTPEQ